MKTVLIQLDTDSQPSVFDRIVAVDAGVEEIFSYGGVTAGTVEPLVHGAMFTRGPKELHHTAVFIGGSDVPAGEALLERVRGTFFGPMRVSVMMDSNGSNTTAAAAVLTAAKHVDLSGAEALILGGTGPVGQRVAQLLAMEGASVRVGSRSAERARATCERIGEAVEGARLTPCETGTDETVEAAASGVSLVISAGAAGTRLMPAGVRRSLESLQVAIDLNAVPPAGLEGVEVTDKGVEREGAVCYGAIGVGGLKMRIHKAAVRRLFESNDGVLETAAIYRLGAEVSGAGSR